MYTQSLIVNQFVYTQTLTFNHLYNSLSDKYSTYTTLTVNHSAHTKTLIVNRPLLIQSHTVNHYIYIHIHSGTWVPVLRMTPYKPKSYVAEGVDRK
jgi:hypothetical protein